MPESSFSEYRMLRHDGEPVSNSDRELLLYSNSLSKAHTSGGSYNMVAVWAKGSRRVIGTNSVGRLAETIGGPYPPMTGVHAELDLVHKPPHGLSRGTVYIGGWLSTGNKMARTQPCIYCAEMLVQARVKYVVFSIDQYIMKFSPNSLTKL